MTGKLLICAAFVVLFSCNNSSTPDYDPSLPMPQRNNLPAPQPITFTVEAVYPHDPMAFTQGLQFYDGKLYEGTGEPGQSTLRIVDIKSGKPEKKYLIPDTSIFG